MARPQDKVAIVIEAGSGIDEASALLEKRERESLTPFIRASADIANTALFLAWDKSRYENGQQFVINGGITSHSPLHADHYAQIVGASETVGG